MKPPRNKNGRISPWALAVLLAVIVLPIALFRLPDLTRIGEPQPRPPSYRVELLDLDRSNGDSTPTVGMSVEQTGFGTITNAPALRAPMVDPRVGRGAISGQAHSDIARFVHIWPQAILLDEGVRPQVSTLDLRPEDYSSGGRLILRDGCLRIIKQGWEQERLLVLSRPFDLFRDEQGYLAIGQKGGADENRLRIGESGGQITVDPAQDEQLEGIAEFRELCGDAPVALLAQAKRLPDCSAAFLEKDEAQAARYRTAFEAQKEAALACQAANERRSAEEQAKGGPRTPPVPCPPFLSPPPVPEGIGSEICRHPDVPVPTQPWG